MLGRADVPGRAGSMRAPLKERMRARSSRFKTKARSQGQGRIRELIRISSMMMLLAVAGSVGSCGGRVDEVDEDTPLGVTREAPEAPSNPEQPPAYDASPAPSASGSSDSQGQPCGLDNSRACPGPQPTRHVPIETR